MFTLRHNRAQPAVLPLASASWQRDVWLQPDEVEDPDYVVNVLFDDFCNADDPAPWLGKSLQQVMPEPKPSSSGRYSH